MIEYDPLAEIEKDNPWYTASQLECSNGLYQRVTNERVGFVVEWVKRYQNETSSQPIILDAGCGDGVFLGALARFKTANILGVDYNPLRVQRAKENVLRALVMQGNLLNLPLGSDSVDIIWCSQVLEHISDDLAVLRRFWYVLKEKGILIIGVPNEGCFLAQLRNKVLQPSISRTTDHVHFYTEKKVRRKLIFAGFRIRSVRREGFFTPHLRVHQIANRYQATSALLKALGNMWKSQVAGLYFVCEKVV